MNKIGNLYLLSLALLAFSLSPVFPSIIYTSLFTLIHTDACDATARNKRDRGKQCVASIKAIDNADNASQMDAKATLRYR